MEDDLFGSTSLFESFDNKRESRIKSSECENVSDSGEGSSSSSQEEVEGGGVVTTEVSSQEENESLVILDETGSEDDGESVKEVPKVEADSDIEVLEDSESTTELSSDPITDKTNGVVSKDAKEKCQCASCPHLKAVGKLKRENAQLRKQIEEMKAQHWKEILRLETRDSTSSSDDAVVTDNKCESYSGFCIDKKGLEPAAPVQEEIWRVPSYSTSFSDTLNTPEDGVEEDANANKAKSARNTCFNCLGDHMLTDCSEKKDQQRISRNRQDFMNRNGGKQTRYHAENDLRFAKFRPGHIGDELRIALSLGKKELPFHVYKMRRMGYPPGWLKEAEISSSGISMYDLEEKASEEVQNDDGEVKEIPVPKVQYDPKLLVGYPGYNVWPPHGVRDEWKRYGFPPMQDEHVRTFNTLRKQAKKTKNVKRKRRLSGEENPKRRRVSGEDMDIEEDPDDDSADKFAEPLPPGVDPKDSATEPSKGGSKPPSGGDSAGSKSPSLEDLETAKLQLMTQLVDGSESSSSEPQTPKRGTAAVSSSPSPKPKSDEDDKPVFSASKFVQLGSPSIIQASKGLRLPSAEKFKVGISEHIPFENLPDSVGKYKTMKLILERVRRTRSDQ